MKRVLLLAAASALCLTVAVGLTAAVAQQPVTVTWSYWGDPGELPPFEQIIKNFEASHPGIKVQVQHAPWSGYWTQLDAQLAAKEGPDVMFITNVPTYASRGVLEPLGAYLNKSKVNWKDYNEDLLGIFKYQGKVYAATGQRRCRPHRPHSRHARSQRSCQGR